MLGENMMNNKIILSVSVTLFMSVSVFASDGQHNDKTCYMTLNDGTTTTSPCSARGTTCSDDSTCTIDGIPGIGKHKKDPKSARKIIQLNEPVKPIKETVPKELQIKTKAQDYNSSRPNRKSKKDNPDAKEMKIKACLATNKKLKRADCIKKIKKS